MVTTMLELVLLRHPETQWNKERLLQGHSDIPPLNPCVPESLVDALSTLVSPDVENHIRVYTSDLLRCALPAEDLHRRLSKQYPLQPLVKTPLLRERHFGNHEGKPYTTFDSTNTRELGEKLYRMQEMPNGESVAQCQKRARSIASEFYEHRNDSCLVIALSHGCFINYVLNELEGRSPDDLSQYRGAYNFEGFQLRFHGTKLRDMHSFPR